MSKYVLLFLPVWIVLCTYWTHRMTTPTQPNHESDHDYYYWKLIAFRECSDSERIKLVEIPASIGKFEGLRAAMIDFKSEVGPAWKVTHQALSEDDYLTRLMAFEKEKAIFKRMMK